MDTPRTQHNLTMTMLKAFIAYFNAHNSLNGVYPTIFEDNGLAYGQPTSFLFQQLKSSRCQFEAVADNELKYGIIVTLSDLAETLEKLKEQLDQAQLQKSIEQNGWEKVSDGNGELKDKDTKIRDNIRKLESNVKTLLSATQTKQSDSSSLSGKSRAR